MKHNDVIAHRGAGLLTENFRPIIKRDFFCCVWANGKRFDTRTALKIDLEPRKLNIRQLYLQLDESHKGNEHQRNTFLMAHSK